MQTQQHLVRFPVRKPGNLVLNSVRPGHADLCLYVLVNRERVFCRFVIKQRLRPQTHAHTAVVAGTIHSQHFAMPMPCRLVQERYSKRIYVLMDQSVYSREQFAQESCRRWTELDFVLLPVRQKNRRKVARTARTRLRKGEHLPFYMPLLQSQLTIYRDSTFKWVDDRPEEDIPPHEMREYVLIENYLGHKNIQGILYYNRITNEMCIGIHRFALLKSERRREERLSGVITKLVDQFGENVSVRWVVTHWEELKAALAVAKNSRNE